MSGKVELPNIVDSLLKSALDRKQDDNAGRPAGGTLAADGFAATGNGEIDNAEVILARARLAAAQDSRLAPQIQADAAASDETAEARKIVASMGASGLLLRQIIDYRASGKTVEPTQMAEAKRTLAAWGSEPGQTPLSPNDKETLARALGFTAEDFSFTRFVAASSRV